MASLEDVRNLLENKASTDDFKSELSLLTAKFEEF